MRSLHAVAALFFAIIVVATAALLASVLYFTRLGDERAGAVAVLFPPGFDDAAKLVAVAAAGGRPMRDTLLPNAWVVYGDDPAFVGRIRAEGAIAAFEPGLFDSIAFGGCSFAVEIARRPGRARNTGGGALSF